MTAEQSRTLLRLAAFATALIVVFMVAFLAGRSLDVIGDPEPARPTETSHTETSGGSTGEQHSH